MKRLVLVFIAILFLGGCCISSQIKDEIHLNYVRQKRYVELMNNGSTTEDQNKRMLEANLKAWAALDYKINDNEEAKADVGEKTDE